MSDRFTPAYSVCVPCDVPKSMMPVFARLRRQTIAGRLELVIPTPNPAAFEELVAREQRLGAIRPVPVDSLDPLGPARARGVLAAAAPRLFLGETHSFAEDEHWAECLLSRHEEGWSVVVPGFVNGNPGTRCSWAGFLADYGAWLAGNRAGERDWWPLNNASVCRAALLEQEGDLARALSHGDQLLLALARRGHRVYLEPEARLAHLNVARTTDWLDERWVGGLLVARHRSEGWSPARRALYTLASPLIGPLLFARAAGPARRALRRLDAPRGVLPLMLLGALVQGCGEMLGYTRWFSVREPEARMTDYEVHKLHYAGSGAARAA